MCSNGSVKAKKNLTSCCSKLVPIATHYSNWYCDFYWIILSLSSLFLSLSLFSFSWLSLFLPLMTLPLLLLPFSCSRSLVGGMITMAINDGHRLQRWEWVTMVMGLWVTGFSIVGMSWDRIVISNLLWVCDLWSIVVLVWWWWWWCHEWGSSYGGGGAISGEARVVLVVPWVGKLVWWWWCCEWLWVEEREKIEK